MTTLRDWLASATVKTHLGVFCVMLAITYLLVRFTPVPTSLWFIFPPLYFIYLGAALITSSTREKRRRQNK